MARVQAFLAVSLDGYIAGPGDSLDWLPTHADIEDTFTPFLAGMGAMLMGRRTFDVVAAMPGPWPYGDMPIMVATTRPLVAPGASVRAVEGDIADIISAAIDVAEGRDVYLDGGNLFRQALARGLVDTLTLTVVPVVLGGGVALFGAGERRSARLAATRAIGGGLVQTRYEFNP